MCWALERSSGTNVPVKSILTGGESSHEMKTSRHEATTTNGDGSGVRQNHLRTGQSQSWREFKRHRLAVLGALVIIALVLIAAFAPWLAPRDPNYVDLPQRVQPPNASYILGTDRAGRDVLSRTMYGGRISLAVGLVAVTISTSIGTILGVASGFYGGVTDAILGRVVDALLAFPGMVLIITTASVLGPSIVNTVFIIGFLSWPGLYRLVRAQVLALREQDFVMAARAIGVPDRRLLLRHLIPNTLGPVIVSATFGIAGAILTESSLSFLGLGVSAPHASWGSMLEVAQSLYNVQHTPWIWIPPGVCILLTVLSVNFVGDALHRL